jgi:large subunit ribosomal protein L29
MTSASELVELDDDELQNRLANGRRELLNLRFQLATGQLDNTERIGDVRRDIARALTILRERDLFEELVELEPLVLTPARRLPLDETGGIDEDAESDDDGDGDGDGDGDDHDDHDGHDHGVHDELDDSGSADSETEDLTGDEPGDEEDEK